MGTQLGRGPPEPGLPGWPRLTTSPHITFRTDQFDHDTGPNVVLNLRVTHLLYDYANDRSDRGRLERMI
jgi:hypothetical protein